MAVLAPDSLHSRKAHPQRLQCPRRALLLPERVTPRSVLIEWSQTWGSAVVADASGGSGSSAGKAPSEPALARAECLPVREAPWPLELVAETGWAIEAAAGVAVLLATRWALQLPLPALLLGMVRDGEMPLPCDALAVGVQPPNEPPELATLALAAFVDAGLLGLPLLFPENDAPPRVDRNPSEGLRFKPGSSPPPGK